MTTGKGRVPGQLMSVEVASEYIRSGRVMCIAGDERALRKLPRGRWIGGTICYFISADGGVTSQDEVFVDLLPADCGEPKLRFYDVSTISKLCIDGPDNGFSLVVMPAFAPIHLQFAQHAPNYEDMYMKPLVGWVAGVHMNELGTLTPKAVFGPTGEFSELNAVAIHVPLPETRSASVAIVNLFQPGEGAVIRFPRSGFNASDVLIDNQPHNLARYLSESGINIQLPLVADYCGAHINVAIRAADVQKGEVDFYGPVFEGVDYRFANPVSSYADAFREMAPKEAVPAAFSCNCILNYLYGNLEGHSTGTLYGPVTFGEIAYQLVNQTLVYLRVD
jgi:hypothetical protein